MTFVYDEVSMHGIAMTTSKQNHGGRFEATTKYQVPTPVVVIVVIDVIGRLSTRKDQLFHSFATCVCCTFQTDGQRHRPIADCPFCSHSSPLPPPIPMSVGPSIANLLKQLIDTRWDDDADADDDDEEEALVRRCVGRRLVDDFVVKALPLAHRSVGR